VSFFNDIIFIRRDAGMSSIAAVNPCLGGSRLSLPHIEFGIVTELKALRVERSQRSLRARHERPLVRPSLVPPRRGVSDVL